MEEFLYIIEYKYTKKSNLRYRSFNTISEAFEYFNFLKKNLYLESLCLKKCSIKCEVLLCGR